MADPRVSIILPTWNGEGDLLRLLPMLARQRYPGGFEIRAIDSDSEDRTRELLEAAGAFVHKIARSTFRHGPARNLCAQGSQAEFLVFLSQDAVPRDETFLERLTGAFEDSRVAGAYARVLPQPTDDPLTARTALEAPEASDRPAEWALPSGRAWADLAPVERARLARFSNVASAIRRSVLQRIPLPDVSFGEDSAWAACTLEAGFRLRYVPESVVFHAHRYSVAQAFVRYRLDAAFQRTVHGHRVRPDLISLVRGILHEMREDVRFVRAQGASLRHLWRSPPLRAAQVFGHYVGSRRGKP